MVDRRFDDVLRARIEEIDAGHHERAAENRAAIVAVQRRVSFLLGLNAVLLFALVLIFGYFRGQDDLNSKNGRMAALAIQKSRVEAATRLCFDTNVRNENGRAALRQLLATRRHAARTPAEVRRIQQSEAATDRLIDAMFPRRDCPAVVAQQTHVPLVDSGS